MANSEIYKTANSLGTVVSGEYGCGNAEHLAMCLYKIEGNNIHGNYFCALVSDKEGEEPTIKQFPITNYDNAKRAFLAGCRGLRELSIS